MRTLILCLIFSSITLTSSPSFLLAEVVDHQGEKINTVDPLVCLKCHEDMSDHSHPSTIPYPPAGNENVYAPVSDLEKAGITILDGKITCITCHDLNNHTPGHPIKGLDKSGLCITCHFNK